MNDRTHRNNQWGALLQGLIAGGTQVGMAYIDKGQKNKADKTYNSAVESLDAMIQKYKNQGTPVEEPVAPPPNNVEFEPRTAPESTVTSDDLAKGIIPPIGSPTATLKPETPYTRPPVQQAPVSNPIDNMDIYKEYMKYNSKFDRMGEYGTKKQAHLSQYLKMLMDSPDYDIKEVNGQVIAIDKANPQKSFVVYGNPKPTEKSKSPVPPQAITENGKYYATYNLIDDTGTLTPMKEEITQEFYDFMQSENLTTEEMLALKGQYSKSGNSGRSGRSNSGNSKGKDILKDGSIKMQLDWNSLKKFTEMYLSHDIWSTDDSDAGIAKRTEYQNLMGQFQRLWGTDERGVIAKMHGIINLSEPEAKKMFKDEIEKKNAQDNYFNEVTQMNIDGVTNAMRKLKNDFKSSELSTADYYNALKEISRQISAADIDYNLMITLEQLLSSEMNYIEEEFNDYMERDESGDAYEPWGTYPEDQTRTP